jgi:uncharacterized membrane protein
MILAFVVATITFVVLDFLWLGFVVKDFNLRQLAEIGRIVDGDFQILYGPAAVTYVLMAIGVVVFVLPQVENSTWGPTFLKGALLGLVVYGVFDTTNWAIMKNYPPAFALADIAWGTFVTGAVTLITKAATTLVKLPSN